MSREKANAKAMFDAYVKHVSLEGHVTHEIEEHFGDRPEYDNWSHLTFDYYDTSVEFKNADDRMRLIPDDLEFLWDMGFSRTWVCHKDKSETFYCKGGPTEGHHSRRDGLLGTLAVVMGEPIK